MVCTGVGRDRGVIGADLKRIRGLNDDYLSVACTPYPAWFWGIVEKSLTPVLSMAVGYIATTANQFVRFRAGANYTSAIKTELGVLDSPPANSSQGKGPAMAYPQIISLRCKLANGKYISLLCDSDKVSTAMSGLVSLSVAGSTIATVGVKRSRYQI